MRLLSEETKQLNKLIIICLLLITGTCSVNSTLVFLNEPLNIQTEEITSEVSTPRDVNVSSEPTPSPIPPSSAASVTENSEVEITTDSSTSILDDSEMTIGYSTEQKNVTSIPPLNALPAHAARNAPNANDSVSETTASVKNVEHEESEVTSTMIIPAKLTTDQVVTTGHQVEQTTLGDSARNKTVDDSESKEVPEITMATDSPEITTNLEAITTNFDVTPNPKEVTTNLAEISRNSANTTINVEVMPSTIEVTTDLAETPLNATSTATDLAKHDTNVVEHTIKLEESTEIQAEITTSQPETATDHPETTTNQPDIITDQPETTTNLPPKAVITADLPETTTDSTSRATETITTRTTASKNHPETNEIATVVWFILILDGNCTHLARGRQGQRESGLKRQIIENLTSWLDATKDEVTIPAGVVCTPEGRVHANLTVVQNGGAVNISGRLKSLEDLKGPLFRFHGQEFYVYQILTADGFFNKEPDIPVDLKHTDVELLIYISVGATCAFLFLLAMTLVACKYCTCRDPKPFEFGEPPNANLRLEDYTLTRIPRPKVGYVECCRGLTKRYCPLDDRISGMVQPFDTSVVPLEDARAQDFHDGVIVRPSDIRRLGGSLGRAYHTGCCGGYRPTNGYATDADGYCIHSTENLHRAHKVDRYVDKGVDNPNFY